MNVLQDGTTYDGRPVGNSPEFMPLDNSLNRDILQIFCFRCVLSRFFARRGGNRQGGDEYALQFLYTKGNCQRRSLHEYEFFIVHYALVLMTAKETIEWMKENNFFHRWLLPMNGLQEGTPYAERPVGNIPKFMPLYNILNRDIINSLRFHCILRLFVHPGIC